MTEEKIHFSSPESIQSAIASLHDSDILTVSFNFDPYSPNLLETYLPDGYITVNGEYDVTELVVKTFFDPLTDHENLKFLMIDLEKSLKNPTQKQILNVKRLLESIAYHFAKKNISVNFGLKFKYDQSSKNFIDRLFTYDIISSSVTGLQLDAGYDDFFNQKKYQKYLKNIKYLNLESNIIGADKGIFIRFVNNLNYFKQLQILNLNDNAIGSIDGNLKLFARQISKMPQLQYLDVNNNLIGAFKQDTNEFKSFVQRHKSLNVKNNN